MLGRERAPLGKVANDLEDVAERPLSAADLPDHCTSRGVCIKLGSMKTPADVR